MPEDYLELARMIMRNWEEREGVDPQAALAYSVIALVERLDRLTGPVSEWDPQDRRLMLRVDTFVEDGGRP